MNELPWLRLYTDLLGDGKIAYISDKLSTPEPLVVGVWVELLIIAGKSPNRGYLMVSSNIPYTLNNLANRIKLDRNLLERLISSFSDADMLEFDGAIYKIKNWDSRQFESDLSTERVREYRKRSKNVSETLSDTDKDTDTDKDKDNSSSIFKLYETNIGIITPMIMEELLEIEKDYPAEWIPDAIKEAVSHNARNLKYIHAILKSWKAKGRQTFNKKDERRRGIEEVINQERITDIETKPILSPAVQNALREWNGQVAVALSHGIDIDYINEIAPKDGADWRVIDEVTTLLKDKIRGAKNGH